jgi:hypothetical protein
MSEIFACLMGFIIILPFVITFFIMIFKNKDDDHDSTHQSIDL